jgi:membrane-associated phospholipid phosphatase
MNLKPGQQAARASCRSVLMNCKLPALDYQKKWIWAATGYAVFCILYLLTGNVHLRTPRTLTPSHLDELMPFTDWTIWIYHSQFFFLLFNVYLIKRAENLQRVFYAMVLASLLSFCIFIIYPTTVPRSLSLPDGLTAKAFAFLYSMDTSSNCLPSLHVSLAWLAATGVLSERTKLSALAIVWAIAITLSTMTTKQHYLVDIIGGLAVAIFSRIVVSRFV